MTKNPFAKPGSFLEKIKAVFSAPMPKERLLDLEQAIIEADIGPETAETLVEGLRSERICSFEAAKDMLKSHFMSILAQQRPEKTQGSPLIILLAGVNGAGKTTTAAKLAGLYIKAGKKVMLVAADTFRAAASEQLEIWAKEAGAVFIRGMEAADPASVVFDAMAAARKSAHDLIIVDTAGRLHNKENLMQELEKIKKIITREMPEAALESLIVIDANTGKNAFVQAKQFNEALGLAGVILTKFDSSSKGGSVIRISMDLKLPVLYYTFGESMEDIAEFDAEKFVERLFE